MPEIQPNKTVIDFLEEVAGEYRIYRAGQLSGIRILDRTITLLDSDPDFFKDSGLFIDPILDRRKECQTIIEEINKDIDLLNAEIEREKYTPVEDPRSLAQRLYSVLGHL